MLEYRVGMCVPSTARLYAAPRAVKVEVLAVNSREYKYFMVNDRADLGDPAP